MSTFNLNSKPIPGKHWLSLRSESSPKSLVFVYMVCSDGLHCIYYITFSTCLALHCMASTTSHYFSQFLLLFGENDWNERWGQHQNHYYRRSSTALPLLYGFMGCLMRSCPLDASQTSVTQSGFCRQICIETQI